MITYDLSFGEIVLLQDDIAEVIVNEGVEFGIEMVGEFHEFLINYMKPPFSLLINRRNSYSHTFEAQQNLATLKEINAIAVISYNKSTEITTKIVAAVPRKIPWDLKIFKERSMAIKWLEVKQAIVVKPQTYSNSK